MITNLFSHKEFFDFGICNEQEGRSVNTGLLDWKEGFGGRTYVHEFYEVNTTNTELLISAIMNE